jgi:hypothetical protein
MKKRIWGGLLPARSDPGNGRPPNGAMNDTRGPTSRDRFVTGPVTAQQHLKGACSALIVTGFGDPSHPSHVVFALLVALHNPDPPGPDTPDITAVTTCADSSCRCADGDPVNAAWKGRDKPAINRCLQVPDRAARAAHAAFAGWCSSAARCCSLRVRNAVTRWRALCDDQGGSPLDAWSARPCVRSSSALSSLLSSARRQGLALFPSFFLCQ